MINDVRKALLHIKKWQVQNDEMDSKTKFIYDCSNYLEVISFADHYGVSYEYALCRWYNFATSKQCEEIFCKYGAVPEENEKNHDIDFYIDDVPFDLKLTVLSSQYTGPKPIGRMDKNKYIEWLRESKQISEKCVKYTQKMSEKCVIRLIKLSKIVNQTLANL